MCWVSDKKTETISSLANILAVSAKKLNEHLQNPTVHNGAPRVHLEIIIWHQSIRFTGWGYVSYNIDGVSWSWQLQGWEPRILIADYIKANDFRDETGYVLDDPNDPDFAQRWPS